MKKGSRKHLVMVCLLVSVLLVGVIMVQGCKKSDSGTSGGEGGQKWYCPDHPYVVSDRPIRCRTCGKDLVPFEEEEKDAEKETEKETD